MATNNPAFNIKISQYIMGAISFEKLKGWIESKPNKDELYEKLFLTSAIIIDQARNAGKNTAKFRRFAPLLEWVTEYAEVRKAKAGSAAHQENNATAPAETAASDNEG